MLVLGRPENFTRCSLIGAAAVVLAAATTAASCTTLLRSGRDGFVVVEALLIPLAAAEALTLLAVAMQALINPARAVHNPIAVIGPAGAAVTCGFVCAMSYHITGTALLASEPLPLMWTDIVAGCAAVVLLLVAAPAAVAVSLADPGWWSRRFGTAPAAANLANNA